MASAALTKPCSSKSVAPTASSTKNDDAPNAVLATNQADMRRVRCGV